MIVIDTHVLIWFVEGDAKLGDGARNEIDAARAEDGAFIPAICIWEIAQLASRKRIALSLDTSAWVELVLGRNGFGLASLDPSISVRTAQLAWQHRDPADRFIVATAQELDVPILTADREILAYATAGHVKAIDARR